MRWGYGHYVVFASAAATGAGLAVAVDQDLHVAQDDLVATLATTVPVAVFVLVVWLLHLDHERIRRVSAAFPAAAAADPRDLVHAAADPPHRARHGRADRAAGDHAPNRAFCIRLSTIRSRQ